MVAIRDVEGRKVYIYFVIELAPPYECEVFLLLLFYLRGSVKKVFKIAFYRLI